MGTDDPKMRLAAQVGLKDSHIVQYANKGNKNKQFRSINTYRSLRPLALNLSDHSIFDKAQLI